MAPIGRTGLLIILDGFGINPDPKANAIAEAKTPTLDYLERTYPHSQLDASESHVGLPGGFMGNSEVGHLNLGAGRIVFQDFSLIARAIDDGSFYENAAFQALHDEMKKQKGKPALHLMGLVSDGGVHSHISHIFALLQWAKRKEIERVHLHVFTDGRDTSPTSGVEFVSQLRDYCRDAKVGSIATLEGRFYAMDRDNRWERTERAYEAIVSGRAPGEFSDPLVYLRDSYAAEVTDEFIIPAVLRGYRGIDDGDAVIFFNFRADRARQLSRAMTQADFTSFPRKRIPKLSSFVCLTPYDESLKLPVAYEKPKVPNTLGEVVSRQGWKQLRIAETEKYAHVTYFFNGGDERVFPGEKRVLVPSPREVKTYDLKPEMAAAQVTEKLLEELSTGGYKLAVINFANCDMVGHTGNIGAAVKAVETVDKCLKKIIDWVEDQKAFAVLTADHGNCEKMRDDEGRPFTAHTMLPVPFYVIDPSKKVKSVRDGRLCDVAPTMLALFDQKPPSDMTGKSLLGN